MPAGGSPVRRSGRSDAQRPRQSTTRVDQFARRLFQALQDDFGMTCEVLTGRREADATACSFQQRHAGFTFEDGQLLRHRGGTERQRLGNGNDGSAQRQFAQ